VLPLLAVRIAQILAVTADRMVNCPAVTGTLTCAPVRLIEGYVVGERYPMIQVRSSRAEGPDGAGHTTTVVAVVDQSDGPREVALRVAQQLKVSMPADTFLLLVVLVGSMHAVEFAAEWQKVSEHDTTVGTLMTRLAVATVMAGKQDDVEGTKADLLGVRPTT
jgi:hypothetical protein